MIDCPRCGLLVSPGVCAPEPHVFHNRPEQCVAALRAELAAVRARLATARSVVGTMFVCENSLVNDLLIVWQGYAEAQWATAEGCQRRVLAERAQCMLDVKLALEHPDTITWPDGHPRKMAAEMKLNPIRQEKP